MKVGLTEKAQSDIRALEPTRRAPLLDVLLALPAALGKSHLHSGLGMRKIHRSGVWETRVGLGLRVVFLLSPGELIVVTVGTHDDVRRFLRSL